jgi:multidrug efflux pump subunit AcrB
MAGKNFAQMIVNTTSQDDALEMLYQYQSMLSESFPEAYVKFKRLDYLEVDELEYRFYVDNIDSLLAAAEMLEDRMRLMPEIEWVHNDFNGSYPLVDVRPDAVAASQTGFSRSSIALALAAYTGEIQAGSIWENGYELGITICDKAGLKFSDINNIGIASPQTLMPSPADNYTVAIRQIADVEPLWSQSRINHRCGERCITVKAQFAPRVFTAPVEKRIDEISKSELTLPQGVRYELGGELEYGDEALPQIFWGIVLAMVMVFFFLLFNFKRYGITTICMAALSLMTPGALIGLGLMDRALGLTSIFGLITLMGMIMRNEILIFEHADNIAATGASIRSAAFDAGKRRMVPIFLTTATTAVGVVPMIIAQSSFWMPVGVTIFAGGIGALIMAVTMLPVVYWKVNNENKNQNQ